MQNLSKRLMAIAETVKPCGCAADIGTDHAYIPIYLCENKIEKFIAGDVSRGSAKKAEDNVLAAGLGGRISVRCGNGLEIIRPEDKVECIVIAGMGGMLMLDILGGGDLSKVRQLVLQPQKDIPAVRRALHDMGFLIEDEKTVFEDDKFYNIISAVPANNKTEKYTETEYELGKILLEKKDPVLKKRLLSETEVLKDIFQKANEKRREEIVKLLEIYREGLECL